MSININIFGLEKYKEGVNEGILISLSEFFLLEEMKFFYMKLKWKKREDLYYIFFGFIECYFF